MEKAFRREINGRLKFNPKGLDEVIKDLNLNPQEINLLKAIFEYLFDRSKVNSDTRSIVRADRFDIYFDNQLNSQGILFREFTPILNQHWEKIIEKVDTWVSEKKEGFLIEIVKNFNAFHSLDRFQKITYIWIVLVNYGIRPQQILEDWIKAISENKDSIERLFGVDRTFFRNILQPQAQPFLHDTYCIFLLLARYIDDKEKSFFFPLTKEDLQQISIDRLARFIHTRNRFDIRVFNRFYYNCWDSKTERNEIVPMQQANKLVKDYIDKYPEDYLRFTVRSKYTPHLDNMYVFEPFAKHYFGSWDQFEMFIEKQAKANPEFIIMVKYFEDFKKKKYTEFVTEELPPWIELDEHGNSNFKYFKDQRRPLFRNELL